MDELAMLDPAAQQEEAMRLQEEANGKLLSAIKERENAASGDENDAVAMSRARAIQYYLGEPFGNEIEGRSQVVSKDVFDTIEWIKPSLLRIFAGGDQIATFSPQGPEDIEAAKQESDYVDYVIQRKNGWFMLCNTWFTDALLTKNAYAICYWQQENQAVLESYRGLTDDQLTVIGMDPAVQIVAHQSYQGQLPVTPQMAMQAASQGVPVQPMPVNLHDVDVRRSKPYGCAKIEILPPERCIVSKDASGMSVRSSDFFEYWEEKTISALREDGFDVPDDIADGGNVMEGVVDEARDEKFEAYKMGGDGLRSDPSMRKVKARSVWIRMDYDGDGIAELRYCVVVGDTILVNKEVESIPVASIVPYPMPHRHTGLSLSDVVEDLQLIKSAMLRQVIDNTYLANNGRTAVDKNLVNLDDMTVSRPGGIVRVDGPPAAALMPFTHPATALQGIEVLGYLDGIRQDRGGVSKPYAGADMDSIKAQPGTIAQLVSAASQKIEQIARIFGEGVLELFQVVHEVTLQNPTVIEKVELRGKWVPIDPRTWKKRSDMTLNVGMGVTNRQQQVASIGMLLGLQEKALNVGLTDLSKIYAGLEQYVKALGFSSAAQFFNEPQPGAMPQPPVPYQVQVAEINAQAKTLSEQIKAQADLLIANMGEQAQAQRTYFEEQMKLMNDREDRMVRIFSEATDRAQEVRLQGQKVAK